MVAKVILLLVYLYGSPAELHVLQKPFDTEEQCVKEGQEIIKKQATDPKFVDGLFADCVEANMVEAKK